MIENKDSIKIESKLTSTTVYVAKRKSIDIIAFRGTQQGRDWLTDALVVPVPYVGRLCHGGLPQLMPLFGVKSRST